MTTAWIFVPPRSTPPRSGTLIARRRTTSSSGRRFARALHSSAVRDSGSRGRSGRPNVSTITADSSSPSSSARVRGVAVGEPVRARGDPLVPRGEQHVLRGAARVEGDRALPCDDDGDDETRAEDVVGREHRLPRAPRSARGSRAGRTSTAAGSTPSPARRPGVEDPRDDVVRKRLRVVAALVAPARDRQERVHAE